MNCYLRHFIHFVGFFQLVAGLTLEVESTNSWVEPRRQSAVGVPVADSRTIAAVAIRRVAVIKAIADFVDRGSVSNYPITFNSRAAD